MRNRHFRTFLIVLFVLQLLGTGERGTGERSIGERGTGELPRYGSSPSNPHAVNTIQHNSLPDIRSRLNQPHYEFALIPDPNVVRSLKIATRHTIVLCGLVLASITTLAAVLAIGVAIGARTASARWIMRSVLRVPETSEQPFPSGQLLDHERRLAQFLESLPVGVVVHNPNGSIFYMNQMAQTLFPQGVFVDTEMDVDLDRLASAYSIYQAHTNILCPPDQLPTVRALRGETFTVEDLEIHHNETIIPVSIRGTPIMDDRGTVLYAIVTVEDITERKKIERRLHQYNQRLEERLQEQTNRLKQEIQNREHTEDDLRISKEQLRLITDSVPAGIAFVDAERRYRFVNRMYEVRLKRDRQDMLGKYVWEVIGQDNYNAVKHILDQVFQGNERDLEYEFRYDSGETRVLKFMFSPDFDEHQQVRGYYLIFFDITERKRLEDSLKQANNQLERLAAFDGLTKIANRRKFDEYLIQTWKQSTRSQTPLSLILFDVDYFKHYNDTYGHRQGDECLIQIAQTTQHVVKRSTDLVARYGGEEFVVVLPETDSHGAIAIAEGIQHAIRTLGIPHERSEVSQVVTVSLGIATIIPTPTASVGTLITLADHALYEAKQSGRDRYAVSDDWVNDGGQ